MKVVIAEDSLLIQEGLTHLITDAGMDVVESVTDGDSLIAAVEAHQPELAIVDVRMPPNFRDEGLRAAIQIKTIAPACAIIILSNYVEARYARQLLEISASGIGYLLKDRILNIQDFIDTVRQVAAGGTVIDPTVVRQLFTQLHQNALLDTLSPREREVLTLMAEGRSNTSIAAQLVVSDGAVEKHISSIFAKLGLAATDTGHRRVLAVLAFLQTEQSRMEEP